MIESQREYEQACERIEGASKALGRSRERMQRLGFSAETIADCLAPTVSFHLGFLEDLRVWESLQGLPEKILPSLVSEDNAES